MSRQSLDAWSIRAIRTGGSRSRSVWACPRWPRRGTGIGYRRGRRIDLGLLLKLHLIRQGMMTATWVKILVEN